MLYRIKGFFKDRVTRGSWTWNQLVAIKHGLERIQRISSRPQMWLLPFCRIENLNRYDSKVFSQNGEDGILEAIFYKIGTTNKFAVEFGVEYGSECNTRLLIERKGWTSLRMDGIDNNSPSIKKEFITAENINNLFAKYNVPDAFDLLSIDIDGNDYWVWKAIDSRYSPRVVVIEYNAKFRPPESKAILYDPSFVWDGSDYYGATLCALDKLARTKGYRLVGCDREGVNAFFVRSDLVHGRFVTRSLQDCYREPRFGKASDQGGWPAGARTMINV